MAVGATGLAKILGISRERVYQYIREKKIVRNADGLFDPADAARRLGRTLSPEQQPRAAAAQPAADPLDPGPARSAHEAFNRARAAKEIAIAKERQYALRKLEGQLLETDDVTATWSRALALFNNRLLLIPDRLARKVAASGDERECRQMNEEELHAAIGILRGTAAEEVA